jgi:ribosome-binding protein aMBF1 (putative translation factor)
MEGEKRNALEARGYKVYDHAGDAVRMTEEEKHEMDLRITLSRMVRKLREKLGLTQKDLASRLKTSQPRVAKIEWGDWDVSLDQIFRACAAMGGRLVLKEAETDSRNGANGRAKKAKQKANKNGQCVP